MSATIKDIAKVSGFGIGTVSRVLNGSPAVKDSTREKILETVQRLNYRPNKWAKSLVSGNYVDTSIGVILPRFNHQFALQIVSGAYEILSDRGYNLLIFTLGRRRDDVFAHIRYTPFSGILVLVDPLSADEKQILREHNSDFVYLDYHEEGHHCFSFDNAKGGEAAAQYLLDRGCRNIGFIGDMVQSQQMKERLSAFERALAQAGPVFRGARFIPSDEDSSYRTTRGIIEEGEMDGLFFYSDDLALGGLRAKRDTGSPLRIIGYDDIPAAGYLGLSTIRQDARELGHAGAERILELIERSPNTPVLETTSVCLAPTLVDRQS